MNRAEASSLYPIGIPYLRSWQKRAFDVGAVALTPIAALVIAAGAVAIKLEDGVLTLFWRRIFIHGIIRVQLRNPDVRILRYCMTGRS